MLIVNVFDPALWDLSFDGTPWAVTPKAGKTLQQWSSGADLTFNMTMFVMPTKEYIRQGIAYRTIQYLRINSLGGDCGYGHDNGRITLPNWDIVGGWSELIKDGVLQPIRWTDNRAKNALGITADGRFISVQSSGISMKALAQNARNVVRRQYGTEIRNLLEMDGGGSVGCYAARSRLLFAPLKEGSSGRPVANVFQASLRQCPNFDRPLYRGTKGEDVRLLQQIIGGLTVDGSYGFATAQRVKEAQKALGLAADGLAGPLTQKALGLR